MPQLLMYNMSRLKTKSRLLTGPLPELYLRRLIEMVTELNGVALAGIQVGDPRYFTVLNPNLKDFPPVLYNPIIIDQYDEIKAEGEGCLSFPGIWVKVPRYKYVKITYRDGRWNEVTGTFGSDDQSTNEALLAKAIQHEVAHMNGITIIDRVTDTKQRIKALAKVMNASIKQNKERGIPELVEGPAELDPNNLPSLEVIPTPQEENKEAVIASNSVQEPSNEGNQ